MLVIKVVFHLLVFAYPMLSSVIIRTFVCTSVGTEAYLRADFSIRCYTPAWSAAAAYSTVLLVVFVLGFPLGLGAYLHRKRVDICGPMGKLGEGGVGAGKLVNLLTSGGQSEPEKRARRRFDKLHERAGFLFDDCKSNRSLRCCINSR